MHSGHLSVPVSGWMRFDLRPCSESIDSTRNRCTSWHNRKEPSLLSTSSWHWKYDHPHHGNLAFFERYDWALKFFILFPAAEWKSPLCRLFVDSVSLLPLSLPNCLLCLFPQLEWVITPSHPAGTNTQTHTPTPFNTSLPLQRYKNQLSTSPIMTWKWKLFCSIGPLIQAILILVKQNKSTMIHTWSFSIALCHSKAKCNTEQQEKENNYSCLTLQGSFRRRCSAYRSWLNQTFTFLFIAALAFCFSELEGHNMKILITLTARKLERPTITSPLH